MCVSHGVGLHVTSLPAGWSWPDRTGWDWETSLDIAVSVLEEKSKTETHGEKNNPSSRTFYFKEYGLITKLVTKYKPPSKYNCVCVCACTRAHVRSLATKCGIQRH